ncbi:BRO family protein [Streptococcus thoraltensis]|uniref:BRO family protein n=1 Tax=Streptococcus thoraltensis TaxID=55085 RepID=UPI002A8225A0|nr:BRO family protein [Streptococcus thoraltensis]MDY4760724.1 BRO family protein [Streptococcus thoraltensis]
MKWNYSKVIDELRTSYDLNLVEIGQRLGTDPRTVGKWAHGKHKPNQVSRKKLNKLYREVKETMTTQVSIFEETNDQGQHLQVIYTDNFNGHALDVYGDFENPLFMARAVAEMIDYGKTSQGYYDVQTMLRKVDEDEKVKAVPVEGTTDNFRRGQKVWFLTEHGLYEVLMRSSKPKAKEFRKAVKEILKEVRMKGYYMAGELVEPTPAPVIDDLSYIKGKLADLQKLDNISDINKGMVVINRIILTLSHEDASSEKWHQLTGQ